MKATDWLAIFAVTAGWFFIWADDRDFKIFGAVPAWVAVGGMLSLTAVLTFFGIYRSGEDDSIRRAIASAFVMFYLVLLAVLLVAPGFRGALSETDGLEFLKTFTAMVTAIVAFYFTAKAATEINERIQERKEGEGPPPPPA